MRQKPGKTRRPREFGLQMPFEQAIHQVPARRRPALLTWLRRQRRNLGLAAGGGRHRAFYELDPATGEWKRV